MLESSALWLAPGLQHPVFRRYASFFVGIFRGFEAVDYREAYLAGGQTGVEAAIAAARERLRPSLILYTQFPSTYAYLRPGMLAALRRGAKVAGFGFDDEIYFEQTKHFYALCDAVVTTDVDAARWLQDHGVGVHLAQLQQPHVTAARAQVAEDIAVSFVGDLSKPGRKAYIEALESAGIAVQDYGAGSRNGRLSDGEVIDVFHRSQINLNFTRTNPPRWIVRRYPERMATGQVKGRPFELAALGRFCLCEWAPCVEHWFRPDEEIGVFRDARGLVEATRRFLADDTLRRRVAAAAHERYRSQYSPAVQFTRIFSAILAAAPPPAPPRALSREPIYYESFGRSRAAAFLHALRGGRVLRAIGQSVAAEAGHADYWRGFFGGVRDTMQSQLRRT